MLSKSAEYALRIMAHFALHIGEYPLRANDIAEEVKIPLPYLSKILRRMVVAELLTAIRGHGGGFSIAKPANKIRFSHVLEAVSGDITDRKCVFGWDVCSDKHPCILHNRWKDVRINFEKWARETTLADVQNDVRKLEKLTQMETASRQSRERVSLREKIRRQKLQ